MTRSLCPRSTPPSRWPSFTSGWSSPREIGQTDTFLKLDIVEAHPNIESKIRNEIARAYSDPLLSPRVILGDLPLFSASEVEGSIKKMEVLDPIAFERFIKRALIASEFRDVQVTKKSSDGGIDLIARMPFTVWPVEKQIIQIQAKRWKKSVGRREIAQMRGSLMPTAIGVIITTGNYARTAILEMLEIDENPIVSISDDGAYVMIWKWISSSEL